MNFIIFKYVVNFKGSYHLIKLMNIVSFNLIIDYRILKRIWGRGYFCQSGDNNILFLNLIILKILPNAGN